jgi:hypothetical protein
MASLPALLCAAILSTVFPVPLISQERPRSSTAPTFQSTSSLVVQGQTEKYLSPIPVTVTLAALGEYEAAFARLEDGMRLRCPRAVWCKVDPRFDVLRADPRYGDLLRRIGLPQ